MASYPGTTPLGAPIAPRDSRHRYPTHSDEFNLGGYRTVQTLIERDGIKNERKKDGMLVYVVDEDKTFILKSGVFEEVLVELTVSSKDESFVLNKINTIKIDTDSGLSFSSDDFGEVTIKGKKSFDSITDGIDEITPTDSTTINLQSSDTIKPDVFGSTIKYKTKTFSYVSPAPSVHFNILHNLNSMLVLVNTYLVNPNGSLDSIIAPYTIVDENNISVS